jgi:heme exporter protein C
MWNFIYKLASPKYFYDIAGRLVPWFGWSFVLLVLAGL